MTRTRAPPQPQENVQPASPIPDPSPCTNGQVNGPAQADHRSPEAWRSRGADPPQRGNPSPSSSGQVHGPARADQRSPGGWGSGGGLTHRKGENPSPRPNGQVNGPARADHRSPGAWGSGGPAPG